MSRQTRVFGHSCEGGSGLGAKLPVLSGEDSIFMRLYLISLTMGGSTLNFDILWWL